MNNKLWISAAVVATLALSSCEDQAAKMEQEMIDQVTVKIMSNNSVTSTATSTCTGQDTSWTVNFGVCYVVNIAKLPEVDDIRYSDFEFYAELNGKKIAGFSGLQSQVSGIAGDLVQGNVNMQLSGHSSVAVYLTHEEMYNAKFYVETPGNKRELRLSEVY